MIIPNIESYLNDVKCFFSDKSLLAYHLVYEDNGAIVFFEKGTINIGTKHNLVSAITLVEVREHIIQNGLYFNDLSQVDNELRLIFYP
jgi:hypothetical protein